MLIFPACLSKMENSSQRFPLATSIVSRRSSRSYSHQTFWRPVRESTSQAKNQKKNSLTSICQTTIAWGVVGGARYARRSHYQTARCILICCLLQVILSPLTIATWRTTSPTSTTTTPLRGVTDGAGLCLKTFMVTTE